MHDTISKPTEITLDTLPELFAYNRARFGGYFMEHEPSGDEPAGDEPSGDEPAGDEPSGDEPSGDEPSGDEPSGDEPAGDEGTEGEDDDSGLDLEGAKAALKKTRGEAAKYRTRLRELEDKFKDAKTPEEVEAIRKELADTNASEARALLVENVALKHGLPDDLAAALKGNTREELIEHAKVLAKYAPAGEGIDPDDLEGGLQPGGNDDSSFDPRKIARKNRTSRSRR